MTRKSPVWHPFTQHGLGEPIPLVERSKGAAIFTADGHRIIDAISSWWVITHGHSEPRIQQAIAHQAQTLDQIIFAGWTHEPAETLARRSLPIETPLRIVGELILTRERHALVLKDYFMGLEVPHYDADDYSNIPDSRAAAIIEYRTGRSKASNVAVEHGVSIVLSSDHTKRAGTFQNFVNYRLGESLLDSILEA